MKQSVRSSMDGRRINPIDDRCNCVCVCLCHTKSQPTNWTSMESVETAHHHQPHLTLWFRMHRCTPMQIKSTARNKFRIYYPKSRYKWIFISIVALPTYISKLMTSRMSIHPFHTALTTTTFDHRIIRSSLNYYDVRVKNRMKINIVTKFQR